ncbi:CAP domain-containing protein [Calidifontibacillus erzurumensis]|uniref:hypothetical protein n=1 Tax=Calidifontibacillus erzurumensis TaxID=2741433 RepID=UPI002E793857|nr:hypothetical protein [Calidifontibacillus erzurumensis]
MWKIAVKNLIEWNKHTRAKRQIKILKQNYVPMYDCLKNIEAQVIQLTNLQRAKYGLPALKTDWELSRTERLKSTDIRDRDYFSHTSPTYGLPFTMIKIFGIHYTCAAENMLEDM